MNTFFEGEGILNIDDLIMNQHSFMKIIEDGIVTEDELREQSCTVINSLKDFERTASDEQIEKVRKLLAENCVLIAARSLFEKQSE